jgi:ATP-dependent Zn protease
VEYYNGRTQLHSLKCYLQLNLEQLRKDEKDDLQAIIAVHESGHAIISAMLLYTLPDVIFSNSADKEISGFVSATIKWKYISRKEITKRLAMFLAGFAAEKIVFGNENVTAGAEDDISLATAFITDMLKANGMRNITAAYDAPSPQTRYKLHTCDMAIDNEAEAYLKAAFELAEKTLQKQKLLLLKMADYLSDNRKMEKKQIKEMLVRYANDFDETQLIEDGRLLFYRDHLKKSVESEMADSGKHPATINSNLFLNSRQKQTPGQNEYTKTNSI